MTGRSNCHLFRVLLMLQKQKAFQKSNKSYKILRKKNECPRPMKNKLNNIT